MKPFRVLVVDDEQHTRDLLKLKLGASGYEVVTASNGLEAVNQVQAQEPDLVVLNVRMPVMNGFDAIGAIRTVSSVPVIFLSNHGSDADKIKGLRLGADDYMGKPFNPNELVARIEAIRRRSVPSQNREAAGIVSAGDISLDLNSRRVVVGEREVQLTRTEWLILSELVKNAGRVMASQELLSKVWGYEHTDNVRLLRAWINRLRRKVEKGAGELGLIRTIVGEGYVIERPADALPVADEDMVQAIEQ